MEPATDLAVHVEDLEANIDDLDTALSPLLLNPLPQTSSTLPLLDKAKLHILSAYAIESLLFSSLLTSGVDAKTHPIFQELGRLKSYFGKIKQAEAGSEPKARIDKEAAARFIKHGLSGNDRYDKERQERETAKTRSSTTKKQQHIKFDQQEVTTAAAAAAAVSSAPAPKQPPPKKRAASALSESQDEATQPENEVDSENAELYGDAIDSASTSIPTAHQLTSRSRKKPRIAATTDDNNNNNTPSNRQAPATTSTTTEEDANPPHTLTAKEQRRSDRRAQKQAERASKFAGGVDGREEESILPVRAPRTHSDTFNALLQGQLPKKGKGKGRGK